MLRRFDRRVLWSTGAENVSTDRRADKWWWWYFEGLSSVWLYRDTTTVARFLTEGAAAARLKSFSLDLSRFLPILCGTGQQMMMVLAMMMVMVLVPDDEGMLATMIVEQTFHAVRQCGLWNSTITWANSSSDTWVDTDTDCLTSWEMPSRNTSPGE